MVCVLVVLFACSSPKSSTVSGGAGGIGGVAGAHSTGGSGGGTGGASSSTLTSLADQQANALCTALFGCTNLRKDSSMMEVLGTESHCVEVWSEIFARRPEYADLAGRIDAGKVSIDSALQSECTSLRGSCFFGQATSVAACRDAFVGTVALGAACARSEECAGDAYCAAGTSAMCPGICTARKAAGAPCTWEDECSAGTGYPRCSVDAQNGGSHCVVAELVPNVALGQDCSSTDTTEPACAPNLWCGSVGTDLETCQAPIENGGACDNDFDVCLPGSFCMHPDTGPGTCQPLVITDTAGASCGWDVGVECDPFRGLACENALCAAVLDGKAGSTCLGELPTTCDPGLVCVGGTCSALVADGLPCTNDVECVHGTCDNGQCTPYCGAH